jgi:hypothetical protein
MADTGIGRLLVASLHQGIAEVDPNRLEFYENWLSPTGIREQRVGLAPLAAALSFLRREGQPQYDRIMTRAGQCSADWTFLNLPALERAVIRRLPATWRVRRAFKLGRQVVAGSFDSTRTTVKLRRGAGTVHITTSVFCRTRETLPAPTCMYFAAAFERCLSLLRVDSNVRIRECRAAGGTACILEVTVNGSREAQSDTEAA